MDDVRRALLMATLWLVAGILLGLAQAPASGPGSLGPATPDQGAGRAGRAPASGGAGAGAFP